MSVRTGQAGGLRFLHQRGGGASRRSTKGGSRLRRPPPFVDSSGGGISALRLVRSVRPCAMLAKSDFVLKTKVSCPAAASGGFGRPQKWSRSEVGQKCKKKMKVLRMGLPIVENLGGLQQSTFSLFRSPQLKFGKTSKTFRII